MSSGQGYEIKIKINGLHDTTVILGHYLNKSMYPDDTIKLNSKGYGAVYREKVTCLKVLYLIYLPNSRYFEIIMGKIRNSALKLILLISSNQ